MKSEGVLGQWSGIWYRAPCSSSGTGQQGQACWFNIVAIVSALLPCFHYYFVSCDMYLFVCLVIDVGSALGYRQALWAPSLLKPHSDSEEKGPCLLGIVSWIQFWTCLKGGIRCLHSRDISQSQGQGGALSLWFQTSRHFHVARQRGW